MKWICKALTGILVAVVMGQAVLAAPLLHTFCVNELNWNNS